MEQVKNIENNNKMLVDIHQLPKSIWKFILLSFQHVFAMFGANILVPLIVNMNFIGAHGVGELIPIQLAFLGSGIGTIIYLLCTGFRVPIYLGSSFAFMATMGSYYATSGYETYLSLLLVGTVYVIIAFIIKMTNAGKTISKILPPIVIGPAIMMIGLGAIFGGSLTNQGIGLFPTLDKLSSNPTEYWQTFDTAWLYLGIATFTFICVVVCMLVFKNFLKVIPILAGLLAGCVFAVVVWGILYGVGSPLATKIFDTSESGGAYTLVHPEIWKWYPDITTIWNNSTFTSSFDKPFNPSPLLGLLPLSIITIAEHIGDHINIGNLTGNDFIKNKPGLHRTLLGDGLATLTSVALGGVPNTSYGENTSVISVSKVASVWVIFSAAIIAIIISFLAPITALIQAIPKPVLGGVEIILYSMIFVNGLRLLIQNKVDMFKLKNIIIIAVILLFGVGGMINKGLTFWQDANISVAISGTGLGVIIGMILNVILPEEKGSGTDYIYAIDFSPADFVSKIKTTHKSIINKFKSKDKKSKEELRK